MPIRLLARRPPVPDSDDDRGLLGRFARTGDEAAFAALVDRHGPMVLGVCRRVLRDSHLADDAFQAVFLVLARKAGRVRVGPSLANWLFGVARRVSLNARRTQRRFEVRNVAAGATKPDAEPNFDDLLLALDDEITRLPDPLRAAVLECFVREKTQDEAAKTLGWSLSTLRRRLDRAKDLLRVRLTARGATLSAGLLAGAVLAGTAAAAVPPFLRETTVGIAASAFAGKAVAASITTLAKGATAMSTVTKLGIGVGVLAAVGAIGIAVAANFPKEKETPVAVVPPPPTEPTKPVEPPKIVEPVKPVEPSVPVAPAAEWVTIKGRVQLTAAPEPKKIDPSADKEHCLKDGPLVDSALVVNPKSKGVKNVVVWLRPDSTDRKERFPQAKIHPDLLAPKAKHHVIDQPCCQFEPRILAARAGDTLEVKNSAPVAHNINFSSDAESFNVTLQPAKSHRPDRVLEWQSTALLFKCDIHPWMQGRIRVFDHPYFAITDDDGNFEIKQVPAGKWRVVYWHEGGFHKGKDGLLGFPVDATEPTTELPAIELELPK